MYMLLLFLIVSEVSSMKTEKKRPIFNMIKNPYTTNNETIAQIYQHYVNDPDSIMHKKSGFSPFA